MPAEQDLLLLDVDTSLSEAEGASWWQTLEQTVQGITCSGCKQEALSLISAMHDLVNWRLGKSLHDNENFRAVARDYVQALGQEEDLAGELEQYLIKRIKFLEDKIPNSTNREEERLQVGINTLGGVLDELRRLQKAGFNALPGCTPSQAATVEQCIQDIKAKGDTNVNPWAVCQSSVGCALPHGQVSQEEEEERFMDKLIEALKKEGKLGQPPTDRYEIEDYVWSRLISLLEKTSTEFHVTEAEVARAIIRILQRSWL